MELELTFTFHGKELAGKSLVTFEELYDLTNPEEPETPETPETPQTPQNPGTTTQSTNASKTEDMTNLALWFTLLGVSAAGLLGAYLFKKYKETR